MIRAFRKAMTGVATLMLLAQGAYAYIYPMQSENIREAYALGERNNQETVDYLQKCIRYFTAPQKGPYIISNIEIDTPYGQIVQRGRADAPGNSEVQLETELRAHPLKFVVRVHVEWNEEYLGAKAIDSIADFERDIKVRVSQEKEVAALRVKHVPLYNDKGPVGEIIELEFDPSKMEPAVLGISVRAARSEAKAAEFDLARIK